MTRRRKAKEGVVPLRVPEHKDNSGNVCRNTGDAITPGWLLDIYPRVSGCGHCGQGCARCERLGLAWLQLIGRVLT